MSPISSNASRIVFALQMTLSVTLGLQIESDGRDEERSRLCYSVSANHHSYSPHPSFYEEDVGSHTFHFTRSCFGQKNGVYGVL